MQLSHPHPHTQRNTDQFSPIPEGEWLARVDRFMDHMFPVVAIAEAIRERPRPLQALAERKRRDELGQQGRILDDARSINKSRWRMREGLPGIPGDVWLGHRQPTARLLEKAGLGTDNLVANLNTPFVAFASARIPGPEVKFESLLVGLDHERYDDVSRVMPLNEESLATMSPTDLDALERVSGVFVEK